MAVIDSNRVRGRLLRLVKRSVVIHRVRGVVFGAAAAAGGAACVEAFSAIGLMQFPGSPWKLIYLVFAGALVGLVLGARRSPPAGRILHRLDRANGFPDTLLSGYELLAEGGAGEDSKIAGSARVYLLQAAESALTGLRRETLAPWGWRAMALSLVVGVGVFGAAKSLATVEPTGKRAFILHGALPEPPLRVGAAAALTESDEQELVRSLVEDLRQALSNTHEEDPSRRTLEKLHEAAKAILAQELEPGEALAELERLSAQLGSEGKGSGEIKSGEVDPALKRLMEQAQKELRSGERALDGEQAPSKLMDSLAELAMELADKDPKAFNEMVQRLAKSLDGGTLSRLLDRHRGLEKKLEEMARNLGASPKKARRLKRLRSELEKTSKEIEARRAKAASPQVERLRRAVDAETKKHEAGASKTADASRRQGAKGSRDQDHGNDAAQPAGKERSQKHGDRGKAPAKRGEKTAKALSRVGRDLEKRKAERRVREGLGRTKSRLRREISQRRATERARRFSKKMSGRRGPQKLSPGNTGASGAGAKPGDGATGEKKAGSGSAKPGTSHQKSERAGKAQRARQASYRDSLVSNEGKPGSYQKRTTKAASAMGKDVPAAGARLNLDPDDEVLRSRIPERYRDTVRTYFKLLPEFLSD